LPHSLTSPIVPAGYEFMWIKQTFRRSPLSASIGCGRMPRMSTRLKKENVMNRHTGQTNRRGDRSTEQRLARQRIPTHREFPIS
jgi:hypothetical protein